MLFIRDLARAAGVSADTVRHYERKGLLGQVARDASGYRRYDDEGLRRLRVIRGAMAIGFTLDELARIFRERAAGQPPCRGVRSLAGEKLQQLDAQLAAMTRLRDSLAGIIASWDAQLAGMPANAFAHLLESLVEPSPVADSQTSTDGR